VYILYDFGLSYYEDTQSPVPVLSREQGLHFHWHLRSAGVREDTKDFYKWDIDSVPASKSDAKYRLHRTYSYNKELMFSSGSGPDKYNIHYPSYSQSTPF